MSKSEDPSDPSEPASRPRLIPGPEELYRDHFTHLVRMAALMTDSRELAEDIVQEAFRELISRWDHVDHERALAYLRRSVANRSRSALRRRRTARQHLALTRPLSNQLGADEPVLRAAGFEILLGGIARLPIRQRQVLVLRYYVGASIAETAAALGMTSTAVTTAAQRALRALSAVKEGLR